MDNVIMVLCMLEVIKIVDATQKYNLDTKLLTLFTKVVFSLPASVCVDRVGNLSSVCTDYTQEKEPINKLLFHMIGTQILYHSCSLASQIQPIPAQIVFSITRGERRVW